MAWRRKTDSDQSFDEELQTHLAMLADRFLRQGMSPTEARKAALRQFGNTALLKEVRREMSASMHWENLWRDIRFGLRALSLWPSLAIKPMRARPAIFWAVIPARINPSNPLRIASLITTPNRAMPYQNMNRAGCPVPNVALH
jgi:hypothetical protein